MVIEQNHFRSIYELFINRFSTDVNRKILVYEFLFVLFVCQCIIGGSALPPIYELFIISFSTYVNRKIHVC